MATTDQLLDRYGDPTKDESTFARKWMVMYTLPTWLLDKFPKAWNGVHVTRIYMNKDAVKPFEAVMRELVDTGLIKELKSYDGCYNVRKMRGLNVISRHSWGIAFDFNAKLNPLGGKVTFSQAYLAVWRKHGFTCGADWAQPRKDGMHTEYTKAAG